MKIKLALAAAVFSFILLLAFRQMEKQNTPVKNSDLTAFKKKNIVRCGPDWESLKEWLEEASIPPIPGAGIHTWKISTKNDSAQFYFNQGINMYYSFHIIEAMASFKKAARFDPDCAMIYWAQALAYGPNINDLGYAASPEALLATKKADELSGAASNFEKALIYAMTVRYTADSADTNREMLNKNYTEIMKRVYEKFPTHPDAQALYADAMMLEHPWDLWKIDGTPKPWTPLIRSVLEKLLAQNPNHPGANHYYIHVMEPSPYFAKALPSADRLGKTNPGLSHVVHMPSHIYLRTGNYQKGVDVNTDAINSYEKMIPLYAPVTGNDFIYLIHNVHMKTNNAMMAGQQAVSIKSANETTASIPADYYEAPAPLGNYIQYLSMTPVLTYVRFGKWDELMQMKQPEASLLYSNLLYHFGRGMAMANQSKLPDAKRELQHIRDIMKDSSLAIPLLPFSSALEGAIVAENLLAGTIALKLNNPSAAIVAFEKAVNTEENMVYNEPRDWMLNPKHYLGNAYLENGDGMLAEKVFRNDLKNNNENGWALYGLYKALQLQKKTAEASSVLARYNKAFSKADINITSAAY